MAQELVLAVLRAALDARVARMARCDPSAPATELSPEERQLLEGLGYLAPEGEP